jgi:predicted transport protein
MNMVIVPEEDKSILYEGYVFLFNLSKCNPGFFTDMRLNSIFTSFICSRKWAWNVIGISKNAYLAFKELDFKSRPKKPKISRGHLVPRIDTFRYLFDRVNNPVRTEPFPMDEFWSIFLPKDQTILMTGNENGKGKIPDYYPINNDDYQLFTNDGIGFCYESREKDFLRQLSVSDDEFIQMSELYEVLKRQILELNQSLYVQQLPSGYFSFKYPRKNHKDVSITDITVQIKNIKIQILTSKKYDDPKRLISQNVHPTYTLGMKFEINTISDIQDAIMLIEQSLKFVKSKYSDLSDDV